MSHEEALRRVEYLQTAWRKSNDRICQTLGKALKFPAFKDDQVNFPGATEADGVVIAEEIAEDMAEYAAKRITELQASRADTAPWIPIGEAAKAVTDKAGEARAIRRGVARRWLLSALDRELRTIHTVSGSGEAAEIYGSLLEMIDQKDVGHSS